MTAYILETLLQKGWRRAGDTFWTLEEATSEAKRLLRQKRARRVRILTVQVDPVAVAELPTAEATA